MKTFFLKIRRLLLTRILVLFNLSAVAFAFQACYGTPQDFEEEVLIKGTVTELATGEPIEGIQVGINETGVASISNEEGKYWLYAPIQNIYHVYFDDIDGELNGSFQNAVIDLANPDSEVQLDLDIALIAD